MLVGFWINRSTRITSLLGYIEQKITKEKLLLLHGHAKTYLKASKGA
jgi:hypothetical protein